MKTSHLRKVASYFDTSDLNLYISDRDLTGKGRAWYGHYLHSDHFLQLGSDLLEGPTCIVGVNKSIIYPIVCRFSSVRRDVEFIDGEELSAYIFGHELGHHEWKARGHEGSHKEEQVWCDKFSFSTIESILRWRLRTFEWNSVVCTARERTLVAQPA